MYRSGHEPKSSIASSRSTPSLAEFHLLRQTAAFVIVSGLDLFLTIVLLQHSAAGKLHYVIAECNVVAEFFLAGWGFAGMACFKLGLVGLIVFNTQVIARYDLTAARKVLTLGTLVVGGVVVYSGTLLYRATTLL
jgi:hypothetical protein